MPHDEYPDEVEDRARVINELRGVIRRQRLLSIISLLIIIYLLVRLWASE